MGLADEPGKLYSNVNEMRARITSGFESSLYPGDENLVEDPLSSPDRMWTYETLVGKYWPQMLEQLEQKNDVELNHYSYVLFLTTEEAFAYYLPSLLIRTLVEGGNLRMDLLFLLGSTRSGKSTPKGKLLLNAAQVSIVRDYVQFVFANSEEDEDELPGLMQLWQ